MTHVTQHQSPSPLYQLSPQLPHHQSPSQLSPVCTALDTAAVDASCLARAGGDADVHVATGTLGEARAGLHTLVKDGSFRDCWCWQGVYLSWEGEGSIRNAGEAGVRRRREEPIDGGLSWIECTLSLWCLGSPPRVDRTFVETLMSSPCTSIETLLSSPCSCSRSTVGPLSSSSTYKTLLGTSSSTIWPFVTLSSSGTFIGPAVTLLGCPASSVGSLVT